MGIRATVVRAKGVIMMKGILLLLIATFHTHPMGAKYLLVQLEDARDEIIQIDPVLPAIAGIDAIPTQDCCFRFGFGSRMVPCCLSTISCDEHDRLTAQFGGKSMPGGGWGKASVCPVDAAEAHQLWKDADQQPTNVSGRSSILSSKEKCGKILDPCDGLVFGDQCCSGCCLPHIDPVNGWVCHPT